MHVRGTWRGSFAGWSIDPSPLLAQARIVAAGMRPIDAVVDATNYTMLELGQPLHGFDLARLAGPAIVVRRAIDGRALAHPRRRRSHARPTPTC